MKHRIRVTGWAYVEQYIEVNAETEDEAVEKVENGEVTLWVDDGAWNFIQLDEIDFVEVEK
jgi:Fe-S cluster assembly iron-binding protein IscA